MDKSLWPREKNVPNVGGDVLKDYDNLECPGTSRTGRDTPESGSLYSDYESGQQYEDKVRCEVWGVRCEV